MQLLPVSTNTTQCAALIAPTGLNRDECRVMGSLDQLGAQ